LFWPYFILKIKRTLSLKQAEQNLFDLIPERKSEFEKAADGTVWIIQPKFTNKLIVKYILPYLKRRTFKVKLDEFGSAVWNQIDGQTTIEQIGQNLHTEFGDQIEPVYDRLALFFQSLYRLRFIQYNNFVKPAK
jgi:hypothetical protein